MILSCLEWGWVKVTFLGICKWLTHAHAKTIQRFSNIQINICNSRVAFETEMLLFTIAVHKVDEMMRMVYRFMILTTISGLWFQK